MLLIVLVLGTSILGGIRVWFVRSIDAQYQEQAGQERAEILAHVKHLEQQLADLQSNE